MPAVYILSFLTSVILAFGFTRYVRDCAIAHGWVDKPSAGRHLHTTPIPRIGGVPKVLLEAAACERAIVTTDMPGCRDVVRHGENGLLVPPRDAKALASTLALLLNNKTLRATMGTRGREIIVREFSEECLNEQILAVYRGLLRIRSGAPLLHVPEQGSHI